MRLRFIYILIVLFLTLSAYSAVQPQIKSVKIKGNYAYSSARLKKLMGTKKSVPFKKRLLHHDLLIYDIKQLLDFYYGHGYQEAELSDLDIKWNSDSTAVDIVITLNEGTPVIVDSIFIEGVSPTYLKDANRLIQLKPGCRLDYSLLQQSAQAISQYYGEKAYLSATVSHNIRQAGHSASIIFSISEGRKYYLHQINVRGNEKTKNWVIRRESKMSAGDPLSLPLIDAYRRKLYRQGLFKTVHIESEIAEYDSLANLIVKVEETLPGEFSLGGGYGSEEQARLSAQWNYINMDGRAAAIGAEGKISVKNRFLSVKHFAPYILQSGFYFNGAITYSYKIEPSFDRETLELQSAFGYPLSEWWRINWGYTFRRSTLIDLPAELAAGFVGKTINQYSLEFIGDYRDSKIFSRRGSYYSALGAVSNPNSLLRADFARTDGDLRIFYPLNKNIISAFQLKSGALFELQIEQIPLEEKFFLGGANSVRGYDQNSLGPLTTQLTPQGGNFYYFLRHELRIVCYRLVYARFFCDNGGLYSYFSQAKLADSASSLGVGLGAVFGVWIGRIEYAWRLQNGLKPGHIYFQIGQSF